MTEPETAPAGPLTHATLIVDSAAPLVVAYAGLGLRVTGEELITAARAEAWGHAALRNRRQVTLAGGGLQLRLIELPGCAPRPTRYSHGWMALEILVADVDALAAPAQAAGFQMVGPPADLDVSPSIRAMQLVGPAGEMLYLTQVKAPVPPFELPLSSEIAPGTALGPLFIAVMSTPSRQSVLQRCALLAPQATLQFDTKVTVLNRALDRPLDSRWPVATLQWAGASLFEVDEVVHDAVQSPLPGRLPAGLAWVGIRVPPFPALEPGLIELSPGAWIEPVMGGG